MTRPWTHHWSAAPGLRSDLRVLLFSGHLLVQNEVEVVGSVTGRFFGPAGRSEEAEEQQGESRRRPPALGAELLLRAAITRQRLQHPSRPPGKLDELDESSVLDRLRGVFFLQGEQPSTRTSVGGNCDMSGSSGEQATFNRFDLRNEGNHHVHVKSCEVSTPSWRTLNHFASSIK